MLSPLCVGAVGVCVCSAVVQPREEFEVTQGHLLRRYAQLMLQLAHCCTLCTSTSQKRNYRSLKPLSHFMFIFQISIHNKGHTWILECGCTYACLCRPLSWKDPSIPLLPSQNHLQHQLVDPLLWASCHGEGESNMCLSTRLEMLSLRGLVAAARAYCPG